VEIKKKHPKVLLQEQFLQRSSPADNNDVGYHCPDPISPAIRTKNKSLAYVQTNTGSRA